MTVIPFRLVGPRCSVAGCGHVQTFATKAARDASRSPAWNGHTVCWCHPKDEGVPRFRFLCDTAHDDVRAALDE